ncbi:MAG: DUF1836 domain-containing protein [Lachnospiraceae bacterium]|nr:DUF1836 domain-containing protein [Lachnospiraceae bacterium]
MSEEKFTETVERAIDNLRTINTISPDEFPAMDLYMDQLTTFMDRKLSGLVRKPSKDKVLTKTMINNYAKNHLIQPPVKKKYSKEHMLELLFIFYFKSFLSIGDIQTLLSPLADELDGRGYNAERLYAQMISAGKGARGKLKKDLDEKVEKVDRAFDDAPEEEREYLKKFSFICQLGYDIYLKKTIIEHMIDDMAEEQFLRETPDDK